MRKFGLAVAAVALAAAVSATSVEAQSSSRIIFGGGSTLALGDLNDGFNNGPNLIAGYELVSKSGFGFRVDGMWHRVSAEVDNVNLRVFNGTGNLIYAFKTAGSFKPYLIGGVGVYNTKLGGSAAPVGTEGSTDFGWNVGAGFEGGKKLLYFAEARFHSIETDGDGSARVLPISVGVKIPVGAK